MSEAPKYVGTLYISQQVLQHEKWLADQAIASATLLMRKYMGLDAILTPSPVRRGDFSLIIADLKVDPIVACFIGIPGRAKPAIVEELFVAH